MLCGWLRACCWGLLLYEVLLGSFWVVALSDDMLAATRAGCWYDCWADSVADLGWLLLLLLNVAAAASYWLTWGRAATCSSCCLFSSAGCGAPTRGLCWMGLVMKVQVMSD